ncbi:MAG: hypothetical protein HC921_18780 [Synechococcaceae cyanobacterium SM2_3_1]|nr:hypothetical protein [Synechococcaceae cyanobacterium SM2_3_1]
MSPQQSIIIQSNEFDSSLIYQSDPSTPTFEDYILIRATADLPPNLRSSVNITIRANELYPAGAFSSSQLNPIPDAINTNWARPGSDPAPDLTDALVVYAGTFLTASTRTPENLVTVVNVLDPSIDPDLQAIDIEAIPGEYIPLLGTPEFSNFDFDIEVRFPVRGDSRSFSEDEANAILRAVDYWETILKAGDIQAVQICASFINPDLCLGLPYSLPTGTALIAEDIIINFFINNNVTSTAGARPCVYRGGPGFEPGSYLPAFGSVVYGDLSLLTVYSDPDVLEAVTRHEIAHMLGFGSIIDNPTLPPSIETFILTIVKIYA